MKLLEHLRGAGVVTAQDGTEIRAKYDVLITQDETEAELDTPPVAARKHVSGQVWSAHDPYFVVTHIRQNMTLQMEDGRQFSFFHRDSDGSIGLQKWIG